MQILREVTATNRDFGDCMWNGVTFVNRNCMRDALSRVYHCACRASSSEQTEYGSVTKIELGYFELSKPTKS